MVNFEAEGKRIAAEVLPEAKKGEQFVVTFSEAQLARLKVLRHEEFDALVERVEALEAKIEAAAKTEVAKLEPSTRPANTSFALKS